MSINEELVNLIFNHQRMSIINTQILLLFSHKYLHTNIPKETTSVDVWKYIHIITLKKVKCLHN